MTNQAQKYIQIAISNLQRAAESHQKDIHDKQHLIDQRDQETKRQVQDIRGQITRTQSLLTSSNIDNGDRASLLNQIQKLEKEIVDIEQHFRDERSHIEGTIRSMQVQLTKLNNKSKDLDVQINRLVQLTG